MESSKLSNHSGIRTHELQIRSGPLIYCTMLLGNNFRKETIIRLHSVLFLTKKRWEEELICHAIIQRQLNLILKELHASTNFTEFKHISTQCSYCFLFCHFMVSNIIFFPMKNVIYSHKPGILGSFLGTDNWWQVSDNFCNKFI